MIIVTREATTYTFSVLPEDNINYGHYCLTGCGKGVDLSGHPACPTCGGFGFENDPWDARQTCSACGNDPAKRDEVKAGPIVHCDLWQPREGYGE